MQLLKLFTFIMFLFVFSELIAVKIDHVYVRVSTTETLFQLDIQYLFWLAV